MHREDSGHAPGRALSPKPETLRARPYLWLFRIGEVSTDLLTRPSICDVGSHRSRQMTSNLNFRFAPHPLQDTKIRYRQGDRQATAISRSRLWLLYRTGCRGRHLSESEEVFGGRARLNMCGIGTLRRFRLQCVRARQTTFARH